jgi:tetrapyrrole methylase family protein/MazG family protein
MNHLTGITLLGLGPGDPDLLTRQAWRVLESATELHLRTSQHPVVPALPAHLALFSFDDLYEAGESFEQVYAQIAARVLELGRRPRGVVYAVPGHPFVAEATSPLIARLAQEQGLPLRVVEGLSFLEPTLSALGLDPFPQLALVDALELVAAHVPPFPTSGPALVAQIHSRAVASDVKLTLMALYPDEHPVALVHAAGTPQQQVERLALYEIDRSPQVGLLTNLYIPPLGADTSFEAFQEIIAHLRAPDGCPWDKEQTHLSLRTHLLEETYEVLQALDAEDPQAMQEEFGDLLLQIVLHAQIAGEAGEFNMADVLRSIHSKIVRRHPHVFGDVDIQEVQGVLRNWEKLKAEERELNGKGASGALDSVALALPALVQAAEYQQRAARLGFDWPEIQGVLNKLEEELAEVHAAADDQSRRGEIGDLLFAVVNLARWFNVDAEAALRETNQRFKQRFAFIEQSARLQGRLVSELTLDEMEALWQQAKHRPGDEIP